MSLAVAAGMDAHQAVTDLAAEFARGGVSWALLRVPAGGLHRPQGDIDVLVHPAHVEMATAAFGRSGFARVPRPGPDAHFIQYCADADQWLWVHVTTGVGFGPREPIAVDGETGWLADRRVLERWPLLRADLAFWLLLWHCLAGKGRVASHHRDTLYAQALRIGANGTARELFEKACGVTGITSVLLQEIAAQDWTAVEQHAAVCRAADSGQPRRRGSGVAYVLAHWSVRRGLSVAVLGPDGAGKSTLVANLCAHVPLPSRPIYMGLTGGALRHARRLRLPGVVFAASAAIIWSRYLRACYHQARGRMVLFDRYVYDAVAPPAYRQGVLGRLGRRLSRYLCPSPDLVLVLDAPGSVMHRRKGEYDADTLEHWRQRFLSLQARLGRVEVLDATRPADAVRIEALTRLWQRHVEHWSGGRILPESAG
jgi:thymidylate kinase